LADAHTQIIHIRLLISPVLKIHLALYDYFTVGLLLHKIFTYNMKFIVSASSLLKHLQQISGVINANTVLPILEDFLFDIEDKKLNIVATDLETVMRVQMDVESKTNCNGFIQSKILM